MAKVKILVFGITGDLSRRKLLPALGKIVEAKAIDDLEIIGISRNPVDVDGIISPALQGITMIISMNIADQQQYVELSQKLNLTPDEQLIVYLAVPPMAARHIVQMLGKAGISQPNVKILLEKPFGVNEETATEMTEHINEYYSEDQIYRIDHYLAKEMAQNIVAFRANNALFRQVWNADAIESIDVVALEKIGVEGRGQFYEQTGALRDVMQGHLMQLLSLIIMKIPDNYEWNMIPDARLEALKALHPADPATSFRAQYEGYGQEVGNPGSQVETFASTLLFSDDERWRGVPMQLVTGKALHEKLTEIRINFRRKTGSESNCLRFVIQPNERVEIDVFAKTPGYQKEVDIKQLSFDYPDDTMLPDAYEQVLVDAISSQKSLFTSSDEIVTSWRILQPLLDAWALDNAPLYTYQKGMNIDEIEND